MSTAIFDDHEQLWIEIADGKLPPHLLVERTSMFMVEHDAPGRVMLNLTAYIKMLRE